MGLRNCRIVPIVLWLDGVIGDLNTTLVLLGVCSFYRVMRSVDYVVTKCLSIRQMPIFCSSSRMSVINHKWSATKQRLHPQSVAEISRHSFLSGDRIRQCATRLGLATRTQISVCKLPFPSAGTAVSLFRAKTVQQRPLLPREAETWLPDCGVTH